MYIKPVYAVFVDTHFYNYLHKYLYMFFGHIFIFQYTGFEKKRRNWTWLVSYHLFVFREMHF